MKAIVLRRPGSLADLQVSELDTPAPLDNLVLVRVHAASLNPLDYKLALSGSVAWKYPHVMGLDGAGIIEALPPSPVRDDLHEGMRVAFHGDFRLDGSFAEYCLVPACALSPLPDSLDFTSAAALPCSGIAAWQSIYRRSCLRNGATILVEGAAGGVGGFTLQLAARAGVRVIGTCSPENEAYVRSLGASEVIDYNLESIRDRVFEMTSGRGVDMVLETISGHSATQALSYLACGGSLVCLSGLPDLSKLSPGTIAPQVSELSLQAPYASGDLFRQSEMAQDLQRLLELAAKGELKPCIGRTIDLEAIPEALNEMRERHVRGKIVAAIH